MYVYINIYTLYTEYIVKALIDHSFMHFVPSRHAILP